MANKKRPIFLPMTQEAMECIMGFMNPTHINEAFRFYHFRDETGLGDDPHEFYLQHFKELSGATGEFYYRIDRMNKELWQLYENTPLYFHKEIQRHIELCVTDVESAIKRSRVIQEIKANNLYKVSRFWDHKGDLYETPVRREQSEKFDLKLVSTPYFEEYHKVLQKLVLVFRFEASLFLPKYEVDEEDLPEETLFSTSDIGFYIADRTRLKSICEKYSDKVLEKDHDLCVFEEHGGAYKWIGQGDNKVPLLGQFINRLIAIGVVKNKKKKAPLARFFLAYFGLADVYPKEDFLRNQINLRASREDISNPFHVVK